MIKAVLLGADGLIRSGGAEIVDAWRDAPDSKLWLDVEGVITDDVAKLLRTLKCDRLAINDASRIRHPPKIERFEDATFILFRGISRLGVDLVLEPQQLAIWVGDNHLITAHRGPSVSVDFFWERALKQPALDEPGRLALRVIHYASGRYLETLLEFEERLSDLEDGLLAGISEIDMKELVAYRSRLRKLRRIFNYHQLLAESILHGGASFLGKADDDLNHIRRDVYDRCERLYSLCSMYYELCSDLVEGHISLSSHKLNETMKILTIISAIFVPMTFMAGIYGMNFEHMPELSWRFAYFALLGVMATMAVVMLWVFKKVKWL